MNSIRFVKHPEFERLSGFTLSPDSWMNDRLEVNIRNWLLTAPDSNPAMLAMFTDRERTPARDLLPWSGEFAGKYLTSAVLAPSSDRRSGPPQLSGKFCRKPSFLLRMNRVTWAHLPGKPDFL